MINQDLGRLARLLGQNCQSGSLSDLPFDVLQDEEDAWSVQSEAISAFANDAIGYAVVGGSAAIRSSLGIRAAIYCPIAVGTCHQAPSHVVRLPEGFIGAQCALVFTIGTTLGTDGALITREAFCRAVLSYQPAIGLVGRRGHLSGDSHLAAIADFALHVGTLVGKYHETIDPAAFDTMSVRASINGDQVLHAQAGGQLVDPVAAAVGLVNALSKRNGWLNAGDIISVGALAPILLQVLPGQDLKVEISDIGEVSAHFI